MRNSLMLAPAAGSAMANRCAQIERTTQAENEIFYFISFFFWFVFFFSVVFVFHILYAKQDAPKHLSIVHGIHPRAAIFQFSWNLPT